MHTFYHLVWYINTVYRMCCHAQLRLWPLQVEGLRALFNGHLKYVILWTISVAKPRSFPLIFSFTTVNKKKKKTLENHVNTNLITPTFKMFSKTLSPGVTNMAGFYLQGGLLWKEKPKNKHKHKHRRPWQLVQNVIRQHTSNHSLKNKFICLFRNVFVWANRTCKCRLLSFKFIVSLSEISQLKIVVFLFIRLFVLSCRGSRSLTTNDDKSII